MTTAEADLSTTPGALEQPARQIPLWARDGSVRAWVLVDDADFQWLSRWRWHMHLGYAARTVRRMYKMRMHRQILGLEPGDPRMGEHIDRNPLNNQRSNLRIAEHGQLDNKQNVGEQANNTSRFRGVFRDKRRLSRPWYAQAQIGRKRYCLGTFATGEEADRAVKAWRAEHMPFSDDARVGVEP
jgi:hypothetical protein